MMDIKVCMYVYSLFFFTLGVDFYNHACRWLMFECLHARLCFMLIKCILIPSPFHNFSIERERALEQNYIIHNYIP